MKVIEDVDGNEKKKILKGLDAQNTFSLVSNRSSVSAIATTLEGREGDLSGMLEQLPYNQQ